MRHVFWNFAAAEKRPDAVRIEVQAHQWAWSGRYAGARREVQHAGRRRDAERPAGAGRASPVVVQLSSVDVIHSLNLPNFRVKQDAVPGDVTRLTFEARTPGEYEIACAQHCGPNHYKMRGVLTVLAARPLRGVAARRREADARRAYDPEDAEAHWGWDWRTAE